MERDNFEVMINNLYDFFRLQKMPSERQINLWFKRLSGIPDKALKYIQMGVENLDNMPRNIPKAFNSFYQEWKGSTSRRVVMDFGKACFDCNNHGVIRGRKWINEVLVTQLFRCGSCERWCFEFGSDVPAATSEWLKGMGYFVVVENMSGGERVKGVA